jgi:hypothetical protein
MRYLVICRNTETGERSAFFTKWFDVNNYAPDGDMVVVDLFSGTITFDGSAWSAIEYDYL